MSSVDLQGIKESLRELYHNISQAVEDSKEAKEEKLKILVEGELIAYFKQHGYELSKIVEYDATSIGVVKIRGFPDAVYGHLITDYKRYGLLSRQFERIFDDYKKKYLDPLPEERKSSFYGILFDGQSIVFIRYDKEKGQWIKEIKDFSESCLYDWILLLIGASKKQVSAKLLERDFALGKSVSKIVIPTFYKKLKESFEQGNRRVQMLFDEWNKSFRYIYGGVLDEERLKRDFENVVKGILTEDTPLRIDWFLFVLYTYYAFILKLFASEITCLTLKVIPESPIRLLLKSKDLKTDLQYIEDGAFFKDYAGIENYIEGGFFSWYLDAWDIDIETAIQKILTKINGYDPTSFIDDTWTSRDLLKNLYQDIVPSRIRHDLGEYYTPDWLIQLVIAEVGYDGNREYKVLDPGCGSGGFLVEATNKIKKRYLNKETNIDKNQLLENILEHVIGFDVSPIAVLTARTNYLISISMLLPFKKKSTISIPVFLADSIITPTTEGPGKVKGDSYLISTVEGIFSLPKAIVDKRQLDKVLSVIGYALGAKPAYPSKDLVELLRTEIPGVGSSEIKELVDFYEKLVGLSLKKRNKVWINIIQNSFAPLLFTDFDFVFGNPPWIKWEFLSKEYKDKLGVLYLAIYELFSYKGMKAGMGFAHDDISIVFTYVAMDKYLKDNGKLGFVLKQTLYKSIAGREFRKFSIDKEHYSIPVKVLKVHDLLKVRPFKRSGSETSVIIVQKNKKNSYPVPYIIWRLKDNHHISEIWDSSYFEEIETFTETAEYDAYPDPSSGDPTDIWVLVPKGQPIRAINLGKNPYEVRHGVVNDLNSVFFIKINRLQSSGLISISNMSDLGKRKVRKVTVDIEPDLVYPVIKPRHVKKWHITGYYHMIVPQRKHGADNESILRVKYKSTYRYLNLFKGKLLSRSSRWFKGKPFYSLFGIGPYTFKNYKVVWSAIGYLPSFSVVSKVKDPYIGTKVYIPDNTIGYLPFDSEDEAHYVCAILNSSIVYSWFDRRSAKSKWGISIGMIRSIPIPDFDPNNPAHRSLSNLSKLAHKVAKVGKNKVLKPIESRINKIVAEENLI